MMWCDNEEDLFADLEDEVGDIASFCEPEEMQWKLELPVQILLLPSAS